MLYLLKEIWNLVSLFCEIVLLLFLLWSLWHGAKIESGNLCILFINVDYCNHLSFMGGF